MFPVVEPVRPSQVELLQVVVPFLEFSPIERINAAIERIVVTRGDPSRHCHRSRMCCTVPWSDVVASVDAEQNRPLIVQFYGGIDARLGVAVVREHQRMRVQVIVRRELCFDVRGRNISPDLYDHSLCNGWEVDESVRLYRIESIQKVMVQQLAAKPSLGCRPAIIHAIHRGEAESPVNVVGLHGVRNTFES